MKGTEVTITLVPGLDEHIYNLAADQFGEESRKEQIGEVISLLLPDLVMGALAGAVQMREPDVQSDPSDETGGERLDEIGSMIKEAEEKASTPQVQEPLEVGEPDVGHHRKGDEEEVTLDHLLQIGDVNSRAVEWAKGNPVKEQALIETCTGLPTDMWSWEKVKQLAERTYNMRIGGGQEKEE